jgi:2-amino-4-hydroxy-6-hydroxymethyldihydropteridine diphosphokinase
VLDVLGERRDTPELTVPHPRAHERRFVLTPWAQVAPEWPLRPAGHRQRPVAAWAEDLDRGAVQDQAQHLELLDDGAWWR